MAYATYENWAVDKNYASFSAYTTAGGEFTMAKINADLAECARIINKYIRGSGGGTEDITSSAYLEELKHLNVEMVHRKHDKQINRETQPRNIFNPHNYLYKEEQEQLMAIGKALKYRKVGGWVF